MTLDERDIDAIARRVVDLLGDRPAAHERLVDTAELAAILGVEPEWVRANADLLGAMRLGDGPRPRLRFDVAEARERMRRDVERKQRAPVGAPQIRPRRARARR